MLTSTFWKRLTMIPLVVSSLPLPAGVGDTWHEDENCVVFGDSGTVSSESGYWKFEKGKVKWKNYLTDCKVELIVGTSWFFRFGIIMLCLCTCWLPSEDGKSRRKNRRAWENNRWHCSNYIFNIWDKSTIIADDWRGKSRDTMTRCTTSRKIINDIFQTIILPLPQYC